MGQVWRVVATVVILAGLFVLSPAQPAVAARVVGTETAGSCTETTLNAALADGGLVTFNCGGFHTIPLTSEKTISAGKLFRCQIGTHRLG